MRIDTETILLLADLLQAYDHQYEQFSRSAFSAQRCEVFQKRMFSIPTNTRPIAVRAAMQHAWKAYRTYAWGDDELKPISKKPSTWFGLGLTIVDAIDTLYIMNFTEEYHEARQWISASLDCSARPIDQSNSHFEMTIRILGGLLGIYHLTGDNVFVQRAIESGNLLLINFNTTSGLPLPEINLRRHTAHPYQWTSNAATSEVGSVQLEMRDLSRVSGYYKYEKVADRSADVLHRQPKDNGLVSNSINPSTGQFVKDIMSLGARGDSYYEYLLKQWLQTGRKRNNFWQDWIDAIEGIRQHLWQRAYPEELYFIGERLGSTIFLPKMDHLVCFFAGNLALGWYFHPDLSYLLDMAKNLTQTCYEMYARQETGLSPEIVYFNIDPDIDDPTIAVHDDDVYNLLRPELIESLYYMYQVTGDSKYQDWGWTIFQSFEKYTRQVNGYSSIDDVRNQHHPDPRDQMPSYFLAETLKYFYLLFHTENLLPFDQWIFNTEGHPLPIYHA